MSLQDPQGCGHTVDIMWLISERRGSFVFLVEIIDFMKILQWLMPM